MLEQLVTEYLRLYPGDRDKLKVLIEQIDNKENLGDRSNYTGHITVSSLVYSADLKKVLIIYHPTFERWQQPGGHLDKDEKPLEASKREALEETGVAVNIQLREGDRQVPILIESHLVPTKPPKNEPKHFHHAFWYAFVADSEVLKLEDQVIKHAKWVNTSEIKRPVFVRAIERSKRFIELKA